MTELFLMHAMRSIGMERSLTTSMAQADASSLRVIIAILSTVLVIALLAFVPGVLWLLHWRRGIQQQASHNEELIGLMTMDSAPPVGLGIQHRSCSEQNVINIETRQSSETILSPKSPRQHMLAPSDWAPKSAPGPRHNMLDRRGKSPLKCDTTAQYAIDAVLTGAIMPKSCPDKRLHLLPVYGFDEATITPPIGSPLWRRKPDSAGVAESPKRIMRSKLSSRGPVTFSEFVEHSTDATGDVYDSAVTVTVSSPFVAAAGCADGDANRSVESGKGI
jgi:hypothetical protein